MRWLDRYERRESPPRPTDLCLRRAATSLPALSPITPRLERRWRAGGIRAVLIARRGQTERHRERAQPASNEGSGQRRRTRAKCRPRPLAWPGSAARLKVRGLRPHTSGSPFGSLAGVLCPRAGGSWTGLYRRRTDRSCRSASLSTIPSSRSATIGGLPSSALDHPVIPLRA